MKIIYIFLVILGGIAVSCNSQGKSTEIEEVELVQVVEVADTVSKIKTVIDIKPEYIENLTQAEKERLDTIIQLFDGIATRISPTEAELKHLVNVDMDTLRAVAELFNIHLDTLKVDIKVPIDSLTKNK